jgi:serine/threonine protein kinase
MFVAPPGTRLVRHVGAGSTFTVALVELGGVELVAKRARPSLGADPIARDALEREASALASLPAGLAPTLIQRGIDAHGLFVLEELVAGPSLRDAASRPEQGRLGVLASSAASLLARAHGAEDATGPLAYVHGDPTPDHFALDGSDRLRLIDHGASSSRAHPGATPGRGTLPFVAPELARGETGPTAATDRYALAVVIAELVLGRRLVRAREHAAMLLEIGETGHDKDALAPLPDALRRALERHLHPDPRARPSTLDELTDPSLYAALDIAIRP